MEHLHAYWRMEYIEAPNENLDQRSLFTDIQSLSDEEAFILKRTEHNYIILNKFPYNAGHLLVIPKREVSDLSQL